MNATDIISILVLTIGIMALFLIVYHIGRETGYEHAMKDCRTAAKKSKRGRRK